MDPDQFRRVAVAATIAIALGAFALNYANVQHFHARKRALLDDDTEDAPSEKAYSIVIDGEGKISEHGDLPHTVGLPFQTIHGEALYQKLLQKASTGRGSPP